MNAPEKIEQRTEEWLSMRLGKVTASRVSDVVAKTKTGYSASRANYATQLVIERMSGTQAGPDLSNNPYVQWGVEKEPEARAAYEMKHGVLVQEVGFFDHPHIDMSGASPDGLVGDGLVEIKCPSSATHIEHMLTGTVPKKYIDQMQWQMACTGRKWCDFVSYDPRMKDLELWIKRVDFDPAYVIELELEVSKFLEEVSSTVAKLESMKHA